jgi:hypothetical protein
MEKKKEYQLMGYGEFLRSMKESVKEGMGGDYKVEINHVIKNNSLELDGLVILKDRERLTPNIYMNPYYEKYLGGETVKELTDEVIRIYRTTKEDGDKEDLHIRYELDRMKSCIIYRLINYDRNRKLLMEVPHIHFLDLAITFHCLIKSNEQGIGTIRITNEHINNWRIGLEELKDIAKVNTPGLFPSVIKNMNDIILDILRDDKDITYDDLRKNPLKTQKMPEKEEVQKTEQKDGEEMLAVLLEDIKRKKDSDMYVISNTKGINGASCLLYPDLIKKLADELDSDLYILPSSIHEIIAVKANKEMIKSSFREMVFDVNRTQVPEEDILSDNVYFYSRERNAITM